MISTSTLNLLLGLFALVWFWRDSLRVREIATRISRSACESHGVQFLDQTVALRRLGLRQPALLLLNLHDPDDLGHIADWDAYTGRTQLASQDVVDFWNELQAVDNWSRTLQNPRYCSCKKPISPKARRPAPPPS